MKTVTSFRRVLVVVAVLGAFIAPIVSAQKLDGLWFKLKLSGKGSLLDKDTSNVVQKANFSIPVFAKFSNTVGNTYSIKYFTLLDGVWSNTTTVTKAGIGTNTTFLSDNGVTFTTSGSTSNSVSTFHTVAISTKLDSTGVVKSATYNGVGEIFTGTIVDLGVTNFFFGGCTLKGNTVAPSKLPFTP